LLYFIIIIIHIIVYIISKHSFTYIEVKLKRWTYMDTCRSICLSITA